MGPIFKSDAEKVAHFCQGRERVPDAWFVAECGLGSDRAAAVVALAVRRAVPAVGRLDPEFVRASDRFPEELGLLPIWDSMDWVTFVVELEEQLGRDVPREIEYWKKASAFPVRELVHATVSALGRERENA